MPVLPLTCPSISFAPALPLPPSGLAWGTGTAVAHRAVDAIMGPRTVTHEHVGAPQAPASAPAAYPAAGEGAAAAADSCVSLQHQFSKVRVALMRMTSS